MVRESIGNYYIVKLIDFISLLMYELEEECYT